MRLLYARTSPYVRKVLVVAHETGQAGAIETVPVSATPTERNPDTVGHNPLGKVPTLVLADGTALFDSRVICEYLDARAAGTVCFPRARPVGTRSPARPSRTACSMPRCCSARSV